MTLIFDNGMQSSSGSSTYIAGDGIDIASDIVSVKYSTGLSVDANGNLVNTNPTTPATFTGTDGSTAGTSGLVPAPEIVDVDKYLKSDGTWATVSTVDQTYDATSTNPQSGTAVAEAVATVDLLLEDKQDVLTPNDPLTISTYAKSNLEGLSYTLDGTGVYNTNQSSHCEYLGKDNMDGSSTNNILTAFKRQGTETISSATDFWSCGYIDIPFALNKTYNINGNTTNSYGSRIGMIFGKMVGIEFIPTFLVYRYNSMMLYYTTSDTITYSGNRLVGSVNYVGLNPADASNSQGNPELGSGYQFIENDNGTIGITVYNYLGDSSDKFRCYKATIADATAIARMKETTVARVLIRKDYGTDSSHPLLVEGTGRFNYVGDIAYNTPLSTFGTNEFDISGVTTFNYLDLHIGTGLAVSNGNLVNTNPPIIPTTSTAYAGITPDSGTLYIITDTGAIYLGSTLIAQKNA